MMVRVQSQFGYWVFNIDHEVIGCEKIFFFYLVSLCQKSTLIMLFLDPFLKQNQYLKLFKSSKQGCAMGNFQPSITILYAIH